VKRTFLSHHVLQVIGKEGLTATKDGLEAIIFTADGDMRQALNNLQVRIVSVLAALAVWHCLATCRCRSVRLDMMPVPTPQYNESTAPALHVSDSVSTTACVTLCLLQATHTGFGDITADAVFKVCDQPHPVLVQKMLADCAAANLGEAYKGMKALCDMGYSAIDIITTVYRVSFGEGGALRFDWPGAGWLGRLLLGLTLHHVLLRR
jgi:DNA polymerase III delta prime subunit